MAVLARSAGVTFAALELGHGDEICPRAAAVRAVLDVAARHAQVHAASTAACPRRLVDRRDQRVLCFGRQVGKVADFGAQTVEASVLCWGVNVV